MVFKYFLNKTGILHEKKKANNRHECTVYTERTLVSWLEVAEVAFFYLHVFFIYLKIWFVSNFQGLTHKGNRRMNLKKKIKIHALFELVQWTEQNMCL